MFFSRFEYHKFLRFISICDLLTDTLRTRFYEELNLQLDREQELLTKFSLENNDLEGREGGGKITLRRNLWK
jgi:hypothetical protein